MKKLTLPAVVLASSFVLSACTPPNPQTPALTNLDTSAVEENTPVQNDTLQKVDMPKTLEDFAPIEAQTVTLETTKGTIVVDLFREQAPLTTLNFLTLVKDGFYDGIVFHRVEPNFVVQFGDPQTKEAGTEAMWGTGGPGYTIVDEFHPELSHDSAGILSMANRGPDTGGSQLFITLDATEFLDNKHAILGKVASGMDVVTQLEKGDKILSATFQ